MSLVVHLTVLIIIHIFVYADTGSLFITQTADKLRELFELKSSGWPDRFIISAVCNNVMSLPDQCSQ